MRCGLELPHGFEVIQMASDLASNRLRVLVAHPMFAVVADGALVPKWPFVSVAGLKHLRLSPSRLDC